MTDLWSGFVEFLQTVIFWLTQVYGGSLGAAIVSFSLLARLALLPWTIRLTLRTREHARRLKSLEPQLRLVREKWSADPKQQWAETAQVYAQNGLSPVDGRVLRGSLVQAPVFLGAYKAVRAILGARGAGKGFLWIPDLARPNLVLAGLVAMLTGASVFANSGQPGQPSWLPIISASVTFAVVFHLSAGFGLYLASSNLVGVLQALVVRRIEASRSVAV